MEIGEPLRKITIEPLEDPVPREQPDVVPDEHEHEHEHEHEQVPA